MDRNIKRILEILKTEYNMTVDVTYEDILSNAEANKDKDPNDVFTPADCETVKLIKEIVEKEFNSTGKKFYDFTDDEDKFTFVTKWKSKDGVTGLSNRNILDKDQMRHPKDFKWHSDSSTMYATMNAQEYGKHQNKNGNLTWNRGQGYTVKLNYNFTDIDCEKTKINAIKLFVYFMKEVFGKTLPVPTVVKFSGCGIWLAYNTNSEMDRLEDWHKFQSYLYVLLKEFDADEKVRDDYARISKLEGSVSEKNGNEVIDVVFGETYTMDELLSFVPSDFEFKKVIKKTIKKSIKKTTNLDVNITDKTVNNIIKCEKFQYEELPTAINREGLTIPDMTFDIPNHFERHQFYAVRNAYLRSDKYGARECCLFVIANVLIKAGIELDLVVNYLRNLNNLSPNPLPDFEVCTAPLSGGKYTFSNARIAELCKLTREDMEKGKVYDEELKAEKRKENNHNYYVRELHNQGKLTKSEKADKEAIYIGALCRFLNYNNANLVFPKYGYDSTRVNYSLMSRITGKDRKTVKKLVELSTNNCLWIEDEYKNAHTDREEEKLLSIMLQKWDELEEYDEDDLSNIYEESIEEYENKNDTEAEIISLTDVNANNLDAAVGFFIKNEKSGEIFKTAYYYNYNSTALAGAEIEGNLKEEVKIRGKT